MQRSGWAQLIALCLMGVLILFTGCEKVGGLSNGDVQAMTADAGDRETEALGRAWESWVTFAGYSELGEELWGSGMFGEESGAEESADVEDGSQQLLMKASIAGFEVRWNKSETRALLRDEEGNVLWAGTAVIPARRNGQVAILYLLGPSFLAQSEHALPTRLSMLRLRGGNVQWSPMGWGYCPSSGGPEKSGELCVFDVDEDGTDEFFYEKVIRGKEWDVRGRMLVMQSGGVDVLAFNLGTAASWACVKEARNVMRIELRGKEQVRRRIIERDGHGMWTLK